MIEKGEELDQFLRKATVFGMMVIFIEAKKKL